MEFDPVSGKMPADPVAKGNMLRMMDSLSRKPSVMAAAMEALEKEPAVSITELGARFGYVEGDDQQRHVDEHWLDAEAGWFPGHAEVDSVLREGFIKAAEIALAHDLPVDSYWVAGGDQVQVVITQSDEQVTMLLLTPPPEKPRYEGPLPVEERIWVARRAGSGSVEVHRVRSAS